MQSKAATVSHLRLSMRKHVVFCATTIFLVFVPLEAGSSPAVSNPKYDEKTLLTYNALRSGSLQSFQKLVRTIDDASQPSIKGAPLLYWAIEHKKPKQLAHLLSFGDGKTLSGLTDAQLISAATTVGFLEGIKLLVEAGADLEENTKYGKSWALIEAAARDNKEIVEYLISRGVDLDGRSPNGTSALYQALFLKREGMARLLVKSGASTALEISDGFTLEDYARKQGLAEWLGIPAIKVVQTKYGKSPRANYVTLVTEDGKLVEARGVRVGDNNEAYDVQFSSDCRLANSGDNNRVADFPFTSVERATEAAEALREQVFVDGEMGMFDSDPAATKICGAEVTRCHIATPYGQMGKKISAIVLKNDADDPEDGKLTNLATIGCEIVGSRRLGGAFAIWTRSFAPDNTSGD